MPFFPNFFAESLSSAIDSAFFNALRISFYNEKEKKKKTT